MPLVILSDHEAVANRKNNPVAGWGGRGESNRVEPVAQPRFDVPFRFTPGEKIFTIGSCFARNVEGELVRRGFVIPMREIFRCPEFANVEPGVINNYGTPSIYNELAWAFGEAPFDPKEHILEVRNGKFADLHLSPGMRPDTWDMALARRKAIAEAYRAAADCSVVIVTLGLAELWFDTQTGAYINVAPRPSFIERFPGRFQLHVLAYEEAFDYLERAILILKKHAPQMRCLLTVSPVPLMSTHRDMDVMVANTYSKSLLRTAAEAIVVKYDFVTYYPSYESVVLSERQAAWMDDLVHPRDDMVAFNVARMVEAFVGDAGEEGAIGDAHSALEKARAAKARGPEFADIFFARHGEWSKTHLPFALEHARHLLKREQPEPALALVSAFPPSNLNVAILRAQALTALGRGEEARALLDPLCKPKVNSAPLWDALVAAALATDDTTTVNSVALRYAEALPFRAGPLYLKLAKWFAARGARRRARTLARAALDDNNNLNGTLLDLAELFIELGDLERARDAAGKVSLPVPFEKARLDRLQALLGPSGEEANAAA